MENLTAAQVVTSCPTCREARQLAAKLTEIQQQVHGVWIRCRVDAEAFAGAPGATKTVHGFDVQCDRCKSTGQVLTDAGQAVVKLLQEQRLLPSTPPHLAVPLDADPPASAQIVPF